MGLYLSLYETVSQYDAEKDRLKLPHVSRILGANRIVYNKRPKKDYSTEYLTFDVLTSGTILWKKTGTIERTISYSKDDGSTWTEITSTTAGTAINVTAGDKVLVKGINAKYATTNADYCGFNGGTATYNLEGNIMSLISGDSFTEATAFTDYAFCSLFKESKAVSAKNLILPVLSLNDECYRAMFSKATSLIEAPELPATTIRKQSYWYMFEECPITKAPDLLADNLPEGAYGHMFANCNNLTYIKCLAINKHNTATEAWVSGITTSGTFVQASGATWTTGISGIPTTWTVEVESSLSAPVISYDGFSVITLTCETTGADIYYRLNESGSYSIYTTPIVIAADTVIEAYSEKNGETSSVVKQTCHYTSGISSPTISFDGYSVITLTCETTGADIYYRLNKTGTYSAYTTPITITADTTIEAYAEKGGNTSETVEQSCKYTHDYSKDYLTFDVLSGGTIIWKATNTGVTRTISASTDNGVTWSAVTSTTGGTAINVNAGDKVLIKGTNARYATSKDVASMFSGGTAAYNVEGNIMSLIGGDNFSDMTSFSQNWAFHDLFNTSNVVSAKNLILPVTTLTQHCYRAMFAHSKKLTEAPELPATTLASSGYWYTFEECILLEKAPDLLAETIVGGCYGGMFNKCTNLNYIKCTASSGITTGNTKGWVTGVAASGTFIKNKSVNNWTPGINGIPTGWVTKDETSVDTPVISFNGFETITITCDTQGADIFYKLNNTGSYSAYTTAITITADTFIESYATYSGESSYTASQTCKYVSDVPIEYSNRNLNKWNYSSQEITTPYSVNAINGHSSSYTKGTYNFETSFALKEAEPTYLWFQHADQSADIYVDDTKVTTHWGGYNAFFTDISNNVHSGTNTVKVALCNTTRNTLAPRAGDFNFNATLGNVKLFTSSVLPSMEYGYDGFHITSTVSSASATINIKTSIPTGATVICKIDSGNTNVYSASSASTNAEMTFTTTIQNPHLWNGVSDPFLYTVTLEIYKDNELYHRYVRPYGFRFYEYVINDTTKYGTVGNPYTGFLLNGSPYLLRGVCMHDDLTNKANALNDSDYTQEFNIIQELGCNFIRLAHYPHPKEVYDICDRLGIVVQTEVPWVNCSTTGETEDYWNHLTLQCEDMVKQHYNHPCIMFWGVGNEFNSITTSTEEGKNLVKSKIEGYRSTIRTLLPDALVGYTVSHGVSNPLGVFNNPTVDWVGANIYVGWYIDQTSNNPTNRLNERINKTIVSGTPLAYSEYGCGGTSTCHSDDFMTTTTRGNNPRHDIEYMMWLHEGHIAAIKNFPQLMFTSQWQLFDIAVSSRQEGYKVCLDGETVTENNDLKYLNNKGLVERDHVTKKDTFYLYKAWWNQTDKFVHICGKNYTKKSSRTIKCYTNDGSTLTMYVNGVSVDTATVTDNIATFTSRSFNSGDVIRVEGSTSNDTFTFA